MDYIYKLTDPRDGKARYVGKTSNYKRRYKQHLNHLDKLQTPKRKWIEELYSLGLKPQMVVIEQVKGDGREREQYWFDFYKATALNIHNPAKGLKSVKNRYPKKSKDD